MIGMAARSTMAVTVRRAILASGYSQKRLAKEAGVSQAALSMFLSGQRGLTLDSAEKIGRVIGLAIRSVPGTGRKVRR